MFVSAQKPNVYIVDDDENVCKSLTRLLVLEGFNARSFLSARSFLDSVPVDCTGTLVSDIYMPDIDGFQLQQKMQQLGFSLPVIFMSAHAKTDDRNYALEHGAIGFLLKPFDGESLLELLRQKPVPK